MPPSTTKSDAGRAGLSLTKSGINNPNPIQHGAMGQAERAFSAASTFMSGILAISASQFIGAPLKLVDPKFYDGYMAWTKESFAVLVTTITQWWAPTVVRVSGDESMKGQLYQMDDGTLKCNFPHRLVLMANHQLYTDWLYLWWVAYTNKMHGRIYIILKESLKNLPIFGWGAQFYNFIFLARKWETDRFRVKRALNHLKDPKDPMWLLIFPEGTNLSGVTRQKSAQWAEKTGVKDMKHQLLPRTTGLQFCLNELRQTTNWLYDCTIAYEGVPNGMYGQDVFTLRSSLFEGRPPKSVNMFWRRYRIQDIPTENDEAFGRWLMNRWREKDYLLEYFYKFGSFPNEEPVSALLAVEGKKEPNHAKTISTEVKGGGWDEFLSIFGPITSAAGALGSIDLTEPMNFDALLGKVAMAQNMNLADLARAGTMPATSQDAIRKAIAAANRQKPIPKPLYDKLMRETPTTQAGMKRLLEKSGNPQIAKKAAKAPAANRGISPETAQHASKVSQAAQSAIRQGASTQLPRKPQDVQQAMPLARVESMVTRPLSTLAVQKAGSTLRNAAAKRTQQKGAALPGQTAAAAAAKKPAAPKSVSGAKSVNGAARAPTSRQPAPAKAMSVNGAKPAVAKSVAGTGAAKKTSAGSRPVGTVKYKDGKMPA
jgi:1-acyl-sn-glycerol-3-phosphate acyltransferase